MKVKSGIKRDEAQAATASFETISFVDLARTLESFLCILYNGHRAGLGLSWCRLDYNTLLCVRWYSTATPPLPPQNT